MSETSYNISARTCPTYAIAISVSDKRANLAGFDLHVSKPFYFEDLKEVLAR